MLTLSHAQVNQPYLDMTCWLNQGFLSHWSLADDNLIATSLQLNLRIKQEGQRLKERSILERGGTQNWEE